MPEEARRRVVRARPVRLVAARLVPPHNLPEALTSFIGRERELAQLGRLAGSARLVTLVGPGGVGKSRLAIEAARQGLLRHPDGEWLVDLAGLADPGLLPRAVASAVGVVEGPRRSLDQALERVLRERDLLLILDNCEHLVEGLAPLVGRLLGGCPRLRVLATSREPLGVGGEQLFEVAPLAVPEAGERDARRLRANEAARLFAERARAVRPDFALTEDCSGIVAAICRQLDGIPLALELAAARLRTMSAAEIARRLDDRFRLLARGLRTARPRQRTLRGMVDWSWELLGPAQQVLLRRLAVFAGGWTLDAAELVCAGDGLEAGEVAAVLGELVDRSLVVMDDWRGSTRYRLLDTMRAYAAERLREAREAATLRRRHQDWCLSFLEAGEAGLAADQPAWLDRMDGELENIRAALAWCRAEPDTAERALRVSPVLSQYWDARGHASEAGRRFEELLGLLPSGTPTPGRVLGQTFYAHTLATQGDFARAVAVLEATLALEPLVRDRAASFWCRMLELSYYAYTGAPSGPAVGRALLARQRACPMPLGDDLLPWYHGVVLLAVGELDQAEQILEQAVETSRLGRVRAYATDALGIIAYRRGDLPAARTLFRRALVGFTSLRDLRGSAISVEHLACIAGALGQLERAARLLGAADTIFDLSSQVPFPPWQLEPEATAAACRAELGEKAFSAAFAAGRSLPLERAMQYALASDSPKDRFGRPAGQSLLTQREREIADLVAQGLSNRRIAERLVIGERTAESHLSNILSKLGLPSRARLAVWVAEQGLSAVES